MAKHRAPLELLRTCRIAGLVVSLTFAAALRTAAGTVDGNTPQPLDCWWRTSVSAIRVGEPFDLILTCSAIANDSFTAVVDRGRLDAKAIELPPFEVLGGTTSPEVRSGDRVFLQNEYRLRFVNDGFFSQDVPLPDLTIIFRMQARGGGQSAAATEGMEQRFAMPHGSLRVASLVPADARDIRDASPTTFAAVRALASRGRLLRGAGMALTGLGALVLAVGLVRALAGRTPAAPDSTDLASNGAVLRAVAGELSAVQRTRDRDGWTADLVSRALACSRIVAEIAVARPVSRRAGGARAPLAGSLLVKHRWPSSQTVAVSGSITPKVLEREMAQRGDGPGASADLDTVQRALTEFTHAAYGDQAELDGTSLDGALSSVRQAARRLTFRETWPMRRLSPVIRRIKGLRAPS